MDSKSVSEALFTEISRMPVIDTHEHLPWREEPWCANGNDLLCDYLIHYLRSDVISAGLSKQTLARVLDTGENLRERWHLIEPYWEVSRYTGYGRALDIAVKGIYGVDGIHSETIEDLSRVYQESKKPGHFHHVLKELCGIECSLLDVDAFIPEGTNPLFKPAWQPRRYIMPSGCEGAALLDSIQSTHGIAVKTLDDWMAALEAELDRFLKLHKGKVLKCAAAYGRTLRFEDVAYRQAKDLFAPVLEQWRSGNYSGGFPQELQDFMMHQTLKLAGKRNITFQFHTGLLEGNSNVLANSDPSLLNNLFIAYPDVDFDLFHIGYPYQGTVCALGKMFPNVFVDMCWAHIISPSASVAALDDFLDAIPYNKISAFGGDYMFVDGVYGHLTMSRMNVSRVLARKISQGIMSTDKALEIARALYYENPKRIFKL